MEVFLDFETGQSLTALGFIDVEDTANVAGVGYGASYGMANTPGIQADATLPIRPETSRMCLTFDWKREASPHSGQAYLVSQFRGYHSPGAAGDNNFGLGINGNTLILDSAEVGEYETIANFWPTGDGVTWRRVRLELQLSTYTALGVINPDGMCRIWLTDETFTLTLRYNRSDLLISDFRGFTENAAALAYSAVFFNCQGVIDNVYITDSLCSTQPPPPGGQCCGTSGPGGTDPGRTPTDPSDVPRVIPPGGQPPSYTACTGNGTPATASDPSDPQNLTDAVTPLVHLQLTLPDATVLRYSSHDVPYTSGNGSSVTKRVMRWAPVSQTLADHYGSFDPMRTTVQLSDADRVIRGHLDSATNRHIDGREAILWIESAANAALSVAPRALARGVVTNWRTTTGLDVQLEIMDPLGYRYSSVSLDRPIPQRIFRRELFPACPEHILGQPIPIIYGEHSDDYAWSINNARIPAGAIPVFYVGRAVTIPGLSNLPEDHWYAFVVAGHAMKGVQSWFGSNTHPGGAASVRLEPGTAGTDFLIPGYTGWSARFPNNYVDITGTDGVTERFFMVFGRGPRGDHAAGVNENVPLTLNVCGIEATGDSTGNVITDMAYQMQHFLCYWVLQNYRTGNWGAVPTFAGGTSKVRTSSFDAVRTIHNARVVGGYVGAWYIWNRQPARQHLADAQVQMDIRLGVDHQGAIRAVTLDDNASTTGLTAYTATSHIDESTLDVDPRLNDIINIQEYEFGYEPGTGFSSGTMRRLTHPQSISNHGDRPNDQITFMTTSRAAVATDIVNRRLVRLGERLPLVRFKVDLRGLVLSIGQLINLTHFAGIGSTGWTTRVVMVTKITTDPNPGQLLCTVEAEDVHDILATEFMALDVGAIDVAAIG